MVYPKVHWKRKIIFLIFLLVCVIYSVYNVSKTIIGYALNVKAHFTDNTLSIKSNKNPKELEAKVKTAIGNKWLNYSILVADLDGNFRMGINDTVMYTAASLNKTAILAALYQGCQNGTIDCDQILTLQQNDIQDYGTGSIRYDPPGTIYSVKTLAMLMMRKSDNTAAYLLANYVLSIDSIQNLINSWGLKQTDMINNKTSNSDMALLYEKIFHEKIVNQAYTQEILNLLEGSDFEDRIPPLLPPGAKVYHKVGSAVGMIHDVGIVTYNKSHYYIGVLTSDITDEENTIKTTAEISKIIFDFMQRK
jgi:beta-lactamase class A